MTSLKSLMKDKYFMIKDFESYGVSIFGNIKNLATGKILKPRLDTNGYYIVGLCENGKRLTKRIHRLLAELFIPNLEKKRCVDHIDRNRTNNKLSNLRWATDSENGQNASKRSDNTSGVSGVSFHKKANKWRARIRLNSGEKHLGYFVEIEDAIKVRKDAEALYFGEFAPVINITINVTIN